MAAHPSDHTGHLPSEHDPLPSHEDDTLYGRALRRGARTLVLLVALFLAAGWWFHTSLAPSYESTAAVLVTSTGEPGAAPTSERTVDGVVNLDTEAQIVVSADVLAQASQRLHGDLSATEVADHASIAVPANTTVLEITFAAGDPTLARRGADALAAAYLANRERQARASVEGRAAELRSQLIALEEERQDWADRLEAGTATPAVARAHLEAAKQSSASVARSLSTMNTAAISPGRVITPAQTPTSPAGPRPELTLGSAGALGLLVALGVVVHTERTRPRLHDGEDVRRELGLPVLASLGSDLLSTPSLAPGSATAATLAGLGRRLPASPGSQVLVLGVAGSSAAGAAALALATRMDGDVPVRVVLEDASLSPVTSTPALELTAVDGAAGLRRGSVAGATRSLVEVWDLAGNATALRDLPRDDAIVVLGASAGSPLLDLLVGTSTRSVLLLASGRDRAPAARRALGELGRTDLTPLGVVLHAPGRPGRPAAGPRPPAGPRDSEPSRSPAEAGREASSRVPPRPERQRVPVGGAGHPVEGHHGAGDQRHGATERRRTDSLLLDRALARFREPGPGR